jgi:hypothetical protein
MTGLFVKNVSCILGKSRTPFGKNADLLLSLISKQIPKMAQIKFLIIPSLMTQPYLNVMQSVSTTL